MSTDINNNNNTNDDNDVFDEKKAIREVNELMKTVKNDPKYQEMKAKEPASIKWYWQRELTQEEINSSREVHLKHKAHLESQLAYVYKTLKELEKLQSDIDAKSGNIKLTRFAK